MADVQTEKGFTKIATELLDALARTPLSDHEGRIVIYVMRKTYGWKKTWDRLSLTQIMSGTGINSKSNVSEIVKKLVERKILTRRDLGAGKGYEVRLQKDYELWVGYITNGSVDDEPLVVGGTVRKRGKGGFVKQRTIPFVVEGTTIDKTKDTNTKDRSRSESMTGLVAGFIDDWNTIITSKRISNIRQITGGKRLISLKARLKDSYFLEYYREAMKKVNDDWWANGYGGDRSWTATVQWFTRPGVVEEIIEWSPSRRKVGQEDQPPGDEGVIYR